jgi:GTPase involved in cell partitioning and DNA repair
MARMVSSSKGWGDGLGVLIEVAREARILEKAASVVKEELEKERKAAAERESVVLEKAASAAKEELEKERKAAAERESALLKKAASVAKGELEKELASARKSVKANSYCWRTKDVAREFEVDVSTIKRWRKHLGLPWKRYGKHGVKFRPGDVRRWAAQRKEG